MIRTFTLLALVLIPMACLNAAPATKAPANQQASPAPEMTVYRSPTCTCCGRWLEHMKQNGFAIKDIPTEDMDAIKRQHGVPATLQSCHTALVDGYWVEGHVPAEDVKKLLRDKPAVAGISVPGMPVGTPGMEMGPRQDPFAVMQLDKSGNTSVFHDYPGH
jgi:hypothetical protein